VSADVLPTAELRFGRDADERRDLFVWVALSLLGLALTWATVRMGVSIGTRSAPFLGSYRWALGFGSILAPVLAVGVVLAAVRGRFQKAQWGTVLLLGWSGAFAWSLSLALVDGAEGLTRSLQSADNYLTDVPGVGESSLAYLRSYTGRAEELSAAARGHPPGPVLLLWALQRIGFTDLLTLGVLITGLGALITPLVLAAVRGVCGERAARSYAPVLILAPYAVWVSVSVDVIGAVLGAVVVLLSVKASNRDRTGPPAGAWALSCGITLGIASLFSYAAPWLGLSAVCLYFARRRPFLNVATGLGALLPVFAARWAGFSWFDGLLMARDDYATRIEPNRSAIAWGLISVVVLLLAAGPPLVRSAGRLRNTPGWPFLVGAGAAVTFSVAAGLARGGAEAAWLPFFPWLTVAAVAPPAQGGEAPPTPALLVSVGAATAVIVEAALATPW
jgi:methylthioxylose transferase